MNDYGEDGFDYQLPRPLFRLFSDWDTDFRDDLPMGCSRYRIVVKVGHVEIWNCIYDDIPEELALRLAHDDFANWLLAKLSKIPD